MKLHSGSEPELQVADSAFFSEHVSDNELGRDTAFGVGAGKVGFDAFRLRAGMLSC